MGYPLLMRVEPGGWLELNTTIVSRLARGEPETSAAHCPEPMTDAELDAIVKQLVAVGRDRTATRRTAMSSG
jgi:hypothetical protein